MAKIMIARCPRCDGWTMIHGDPTSATAVEWSAACRRDGDIVTVIDEADRPSPDHLCPDVYGKVASARTCTRPTQLAAVPSC